MKESKVLNRKDIRNLGFRSSLLQASFNYERMQAGGFTWAMIPALEKVYKDDEEGLKGALSDNLEFINTNPNMAGFLMGLLLSMEEKKESRATIKGLKVALFGPIAGIADAIFWFTLLPIMAGVCASFASKGSILGPLIFFAVYFAVFILRVGWTILGYELGLSVIDKISANSALIARCASILGVCVVGGLIASYVQIEVLASFQIDGEHSVSVQKDFFDKILPNILPLGYVFLMYYLLKVRQTHPVALILLTLALSILGSFLGWL